MRHERLRHRNGLRRSRHRRLLRRVRRAGRLRRQGRRRRSRRSSAARSRSTSRASRRSSRATCASGRLSFTTDTAEAVRASLVVFIAVQTPAARRRQHRSHAPSKPSRARSAATMDGYKVIVTKSTVPVGTSYRVRELDRRGARRRRATSARFSVASNPEFLREGAAIGDFMRPDRVVIGADDDAGDRDPEGSLPAALPDRDALRDHQHRDRGADQVRRQRVPRDQDLVHQRDGEPVRGGRRATCTRSRAASASTGASARSSCTPGPGFGGSCFPKDTRSAAHFAREAGEPLEIVEAVIRVNERQRERMVEKIDARARRRRAGQDRRACSGSPSSPRPTTCATRPRSTSSAACSQRGAAVRAFDPVAMPNAAQACCPTSRSARTPTRPARAPTRWCSSPSGTSSACSISSA